MSLPPNVFGGLLNPLGSGGSITPPVHGDSILLESGDHILTEAGDYILLE